eukprot:scaffold187079_cov30-Tisochrysis_lutea.AAC.3
MRPICHLFTPLNCTLSGRRVALAEGGLARARVSDDDAIATARDLAATEGLMCGISSGASVWAAKQLAMRWVLRPPKAFDVDRARHATLGAFDKQATWPYCCGSVLPRSV